MTSEIIGKSNRINWPGDLHYRHQLHGLTDDNGYITAYPYPLFEVVNPKLPSSCFFRALTNTDRNYPYQEAFWGYHELVFEQDHYNKLVEKDEEAVRKYFNRKIELEEELNKISSK